MYRSLIAFAVIITPIMAITGPTRPDTRHTCESEGDKVVDQENMCWYHECTAGDDGKLVFIPKRCSLGSKISYNFVSGQVNPCIVNFDDVVGYDCDRVLPSFDGLPPCHPVPCENRGKAVYESDKCWCVCPGSWQGNVRCDFPTLFASVSKLPEGSNICVESESSANWCASSPCLHDGRCFNICDTFWCECPDHHEGKRCEL